MVDDLVEIDTETLSENFVFDEAQSLRDDEIDDLAKDDPELSTEVEWGLEDRLDDSDAEVEEAPEAGKTGSTR